MVQTELSERASRGVIQAAHNRHTELFPRAASEGQPTTTGDASCPTAEFGRDASAPAIPTARLQWMLRKLLLRLHFTYAFLRSAPFATFFMHLHPMLVNYSVL